MLALAVVLAPAAALRAPITQLKQGPRRALRRAAAAGPPASRAEDLVANAGDLRLFTPLGPRKPAAPLDGDALAANALSGFAVSLAMIPEAVAFAFVAGVSPIVGLQTTAVLGFVAAAFGGRGGMTSGASGACAVVVAGLVREHGAGYLPGCVVLAGFAQTFLGLVGAGKFIRMVPHPVMLGFVNGLAVVMLSAQLTHFRRRAGPPVARVPDDGRADRGDDGARDRRAAALCTVAPYAATMAVVGIVESLLTMQLVDGLADDGTRGSTRQECVGQGLRNLASGLLGGQGGCALIGQSLINVQPSARASSCRRWPSPGSSRSGSARTPPRRRRPQDLRSAGLFFGSSTAFRELFAPSDDPTDVVLDFSGSRVLDHSALGAINDVAARYAALGKTLRLRRLSPDCYELLAARNGAWSALVLEADADSDPIYEVAALPKKGAIVPPKPPKPTTRDRPTGAGFGEAG
ncbi:secondary active sulfate transmembrane transporter [Aureococcus anophagefferens]|nr:secondary active sulfate transmembrane transporter [Aureococcus anophagefferens]